MKITVVASSWAKRYVPNGSAEIELLAGAVVQDILAPLGIPPEEVGMFAIHGAAVPGGTPLVDGNCVRIFPVIMGG